MDREMVLQNIMNNYGKYGITKDMVEEVIDAGLEGSMSYDLIYFDICRRNTEPVCQCGLDGLYGPAGYPEKRV